MSRGNTTAAMRRARNKHGRGPERGTEERGSRKKTGSGKKNAQNVAKMIPGKETVKRHRAKLSCNPLQSKRTRKNRGNNPLLTNETSFNYRVVKRLKESKPHERRLAHKSKNRSDTSSGLKARNNRVRKTAAIRRQREMGASEHGRRELSRLERQPEEKNTNRVASRKRRLKGRRGGFWGRG